MKKLFLLLLLLIPTNSHAWDVTSACLGQWHLNNNAASQTVTDSCASLGGLTFYSGGAINTSTITTTGKLNSAFAFDGATSKRGVDITTHSALSFARTDPWSVEAWFKTSDSTNELDITSKMDCNANCGGWAVEIASGKIQVLIINTVASNWIQQLSTSTYSDNAFHHLVVTYSGSSSAAGLTFYIDGVSVSKAAAAADSLSSAISYTNANPAIGVRNSASTGTIIPFNGTLDEVVIYNRVLTPTEVTGRYNGGTGTESLSSVTNTGNFFQLL